MKIINKETFLKLPAKTIYSEYEPCIFDGLFVKGDTWPCDYLEQNIIGNVYCSSSEEFSRILVQSEETGHSFNLDFDCNGRNGLFDDKQLYAIYEKEDLENLIAVLEEGIGVLKDES